MKELPGIDTPVVDALREVGGNELVGQLFELFIEYTPTRLKGIRDAIRSGSAHDLAYWAHSLRSGAASIGAGELSNRAAALERIAEAEVDAGLASGGTDLRARTAASHADLLSCFEQLEQMLRGYLVDRTRQEVRSA